VGGRRGRLLRAALHDHRLPARLPGDAAALVGGLAASLRDGGRLRQGTFSSRGLATAIAFTGLLATMPYIALQLVGIEVVLAGLGIEGEWPLILAFAILAAYTYTSGLRAPAMIALVKDTLIYATVIVALIYIPSQLGGWDNIFALGRRWWRWRSTSWWPPP
jgi:hypothetical protein